MRSSCRAEHFTIGGRNDTTDNVFGADVFVAIIKTEKYLIICSKNIGCPNGPFCVPAKVNQVTFNYISNTKYFDEFFVFEIRLAAEMIPLTMSLALTSLLLKTETEICGQWKTISSKLCVGAVCDSPDM